MSQDKPVMERMTREDLYDFCCRIANGDQWALTRLDSSLALLGLERQGSGKWVPLEPTSEMIQAMEDRQIEGASYIAENSIQYALWKEVWKAALAASPQAQDAQTGEK